MKTNNKKKGSPMKKLIPAAGSLAVSAVMLSTSTYAWFTMNKTVTVSGMEMKTTVGSNLLISDNNYEADYSTAALTQGRKALLEPVSSVSGANGTFWYTVDALGNGDARTDAYTSYHETAEVSGSEDTSGKALTASAIDVITASTAAGTHPSTGGAGKAYYDDEFNATYTISDAAAGQTTAFKNAYGYVDYVFYLKGTADAINQNIRMTKCNLVYDDKAITSPAFGSGDAVVGDNVDKAWRAAVFCSAIDAANAGKGEITTSNAIVGNLKAILTLEGAANQSGNTAISANSAPTALAQNYNTWSDTTNSAIATLADKATGYYMVTVRVWLEGEDTTCTSKTYAQLDKSWKLDCEFSMDASKSAVTKIDSEVAGG
ncbi:hypothetical protein [uncultured Ruminococcus sp.]|uniref:hypothetical protein n=1 Tax=uncultured Ruminococcus sp. TaxID=165186 RepID=UPI0025F59B61|nr:hypothetical protein [uncultured Ruminococcus sp.]